MTPEQQARTIIDLLLQQAGWTFTIEVHASGSDREGFADYILYDPDGTAIALLEAKSAEKHPLVGKEQARDYAISLDIAYVILSNGSQHYVWDTRTGNPVRALSLPSPQAIASINRSPPRQRASLWTTPVDADYLQQKAQADRAMRDYQVAAIAAIRQRAQEGETAFLLEMATGTGKTTVAARRSVSYTSIPAMHAAFYSWLTALSCASKPSRASTTTSTSSTPSRLMRAIAISTGSAPPSP